MKTEVLFVENMKAKGKRSVQAQRKFAQGAYIPPSNQTMERRRDTGQRDYNIPKIVRKTRINMSAASLLDHITFKNLYPHLQPIVLLERLKCTSVEVATPNKSQPGSSNQINILDEEHNNNVPAKMQQREHRSKSRCSIMTRSRSCNRYTGDAKEKLKKKRVTFRDDFSIDDNRPLTFFTSNVAARTRRSRVDYDRDRDEVEPTQAPTNHKQQESLLDKQGEHSARRGRPAHVKNSPATITTDLDQDPGQSNATLQPEDISLVTNNSCPSLKYSHAKDVLSAAAKEELKHRCNLCMSCKSVDKLLQIASLVENPLSISPGESIDVYQIDANEHADNTSDQPKYNASSPATCSSTSNANSVPIYLDIMSEECTHVIQIMWDENNDRILRARLVPKAQVNINNELSLNTHGNLMDQFINTLNESSTLRMFKLLSDTMEGYENMLHNDVQWWKKKFKTGINSSTASTSAQPFEVPEEVQNERVESPPVDRLGTNNVENINVDFNDMETVEMNESTFDVDQLEPVPTDSETIPTQGEAGQSQAVLREPQPGEFTTINTDNYLSEENISSIIKRAIIQNNIMRQKQIESQKYNCRPERNILPPAVSTTSVTPSKRKITKKTKTLAKSGGSLLKKKGFKKANTRKNVSTPIRATKRQSARLMAKTIYGAPTPGRSTTRIECVRTQRNTLPTPRNLSLTSKNVNTPIPIPIPILHETSLSQPSTSSATQLSQPLISKRSTSLVQLPEQTTGRKRRASINIARKKVKMLRNSMPGTLTTENVEIDSASSDSGTPLHWATSAKTLFVNKANKPAAGSNNREGLGTRNSFPRGCEKAELVNALVFYPTKAEFVDPIAYFEKIMPMAKKFGLCKVVPPNNFSPTCHIKDEMRFSVSNQYIARMYSRWGVAQREMCAIKVNSATQGVVFNKAPLLDCMEVNLPKLYHLVQHIGGLKKVIEKKKWTRIAEDLRVNQCLNPERKLDCIYVKYLLSYDTLTNEERQKMLRKVESCWHKYNMKMLERAMNPLHGKKKLLGESDSSGDEEEEEMDRFVVSALAEAEDCVVEGRQMNLSMFKKIAKGMMYVHFPNIPQPIVDDVENEYWRIVLLAAEHVCVNVASVDTGPQGYGFTKNKNDSYGRHPWNLKVLCQNPGNILRSLSSVLGVTAPTLHLGMCFSCSCWHRDPHGLPWMEYMHSGPGKIWYGIPDEQSDNFRKAVEALCPTSYRNKSIWLPSDITMIPPNLLREHNVSLSRVVQKPGEFIIVFPKAYSCSISTGYTESESAYFATSSWLASVHQIFQELRESCEPTAFSVEQLLVSVARDPRVSLSVLQQVHGNLTTVICDELSYRQILLKKGIKVIYGEISMRTRQRRGWNSRNDECDICRSVLYLSKVIGITTKKSQVCLQHAVDLIRVRGNRVNIAQVEMIVPFSDEELKNIVTNVVERLTHL